MNAWLRQHLQAAASALRRLGVLNTLVIGVALSLPAGGYALLESLRGLAARLSLDPQVTVFLHPTAKADAVFEWLLGFRWNEGSYFRCGYGSPRHGVVDTANSDDILHMGFIRH